VYQESLCGLAGSWYAVVFTSARIPGKVAAQALRKRYQLITLRSSWYKNQKQETATGGDLDFA